MAVGGDGDGRSWVDVWISHSLGSQCALSVLSSGCSGSSKAVGSHSSLGRLRCKYTCCLIGCVVVLCSVVRALSGGLEKPAAWVQSNIWGAPQEGVRKNPPPSSALFACLPKPHHLVWPKSGSGPITTCLRPFWWQIFTFARNGPFSRNFHTPASCWKGGSSTLCAPFLHPLCTLCAPPFLH